MKQKKDDEIRVEKERKERERRLQEELEIAKMIAENGELFMAPDE